MNENNDMYATVYNDSNTFIWSEKLKCLNFNG